MTSEFSIKDDERESGLNDLCFTPYLGVQDILDLLARKPKHFHTTICFYSPKDQG
jgi:hypothetical protein